MKVSQTRNMTSNTGIPYAFVEIGVILFFGGNTFHEVTSINECGRPFHNDLDLFQLEKDLKVQAIVLEK